LSPSRSADSASSLAANSEGPILGQSASIHALKALIHRVASSKTNILIIGESGTGKELVARMVHDSGPLKSKPFVPVNCGAIPENLIETEMFGHHKGSFTGATSDKEGLFQVANGGTLFLDEVGELPLSMQVKLLRAIQEKRIRKVGGLEDSAVDVRIIAATNRDLELAVKKGTFREDLYYRLNVILIKTPPLRERRTDVLLLANHFLRTSASKSKKSIQAFSPEAVAALEGYPWPGNVRELENVIERAVTLESHSLIGLASLPQVVREARSREQGEEPGVSERKGIYLPSPDFESETLNLEKILEDVERVYLIAAMSRAGGAKKKAAALLGLTLRSIRYRLIKLGLESKS
jgi:two-component system response regulator PilR (NtrC family)